MATPHINAEMGDFAKTVLMPGDPLRAKFIAENFLKDAVLVNNVRGIQGYTGTYKGVPVSVMASGMGIPSIAIYSYELYTKFGVENIIRVGTAGGMNEKIKVRDVVLGMGACTNSSFAHQYDLPGTFSATASYSLLEASVSKARELGLSFHVGSLLSSDTFYSDIAQKQTQAWAKMGVMAVEMEAYGLYATASRLGKKALAICTISDHVITGESSRAQERQTSFTDMMRLALEVAISQ